MIWYWKLVRKNQKGKEVNKELLLCLACNLKNMWPPPSLLKAINWQLMTAHQCDQCSRSELRHKRDAFLENLSKAWVQTSQISYERQLKSLRAQECQCKSSARILRIHGKGQNGGIIAITVQDESGEWTEVTKHCEIKKECLQGNRLQFSESNQAGTPFTREPLLLDFRYLAKRRNARKVVTASYEPPMGTNPHARTLKTT